MRKLAAIIFLSAFLYSRNSYSQTEAVITALEQQLELTQGDEEPDLSELTESLEYYSRHPLNLNKTTPEELRKSGFFTDNMILKLLEHIRIYGKLQAIQELQQLDFSLSFIRQIEPYVTTGKAVDEPNASFKRMINEGVHQLIVRTQFTPEKKKGFIENDYLGDPFAVYARYRFTFMKKISWGITAEKDAGEGFFSGPQKKGFDFYSAHFALKNAGRFRTLLVGDYQCEYGQGLVLWTGLSGGKGYDPLMIKRNAQGIKAYTSSNEAFFKRGAAVSVSLNRKIISDIFISYKSIDANLQLTNDTLETADQFTSFQESGYHRTNSEQEDKNSVKELFYGSNIEFQNLKNNFQAGATISTTGYSLPLAEKNEAYNKYEFSGNNVLNYGIHYSWLFKNANFFGENAFDKQGNKAMLHGVVISLDPRLSVSALVRYYPVQFKSVGSSAFRESGNNSNEYGVFTGLTLRPSRLITVSCALDRFTFPWLRYRTDAPSFGYEGSGTIIYTPSRKTELYLRYRKSDKMINTSDEDVYVSYLVHVLQEGIRINLTSKISKAVTLKTRVEAVRIKNGVQLENGLLVFQDFQFHPMGFPFSFNLRYALFDSDSYNSRIYAYENDVLYGYSIPSFYNSGNRFYFNLRYKVFKGFDLWIKYSRTTYTNVTVIGSGNDEINGRIKSEIKLQVRYEW
jgi:hypothetical protein